MILNLVKKIFKENYGNTESINFNYHQTKFGLQEAFFYNTVMFTGPSTA